MQVLKDDCLGFSTLCFKLNMGWLHTLRAASKITQIQILYMCLLLLYLSLNSKSSDYNACSQWWQIFFFPFSEAWQKYFGFEPLNYYIHSRIIIRVDGRLTRHFWGLNKNSLKECIQRVMTKNYLLLITILNNNYQNWSK